MLARLLASVAAAGGLSGDDVAVVARMEGRSLGMARASAGSCVAALVDELGDLGFDPASATDGTTTTIAFTRCPFFELANAFPEIVCHLHRGIVEGMVDELGGVGEEVSIERFATLADRDPCRVDLAVR
jgi:predicted ArsR family transcriptional regulator